VRRLHGAKLPPRDRPDAAIYVTAAGGLFALDVRP